MIMATLLATSAVVLAAAHAAAAQHKNLYEPPPCPGIRLPNGICTPAAGPQGDRVNAPPVQPVQPWYLAAPPPAINISIGRQLFVDSFLLLDPSTTRTSYHQAEWLPQSLMRYDEPWESWPLEDHEQCPSAAALVSLSLSLSLSHTHTHTHSLSLSLSLSLTHFPSRSHALCLAAFLALSVVSCLWCQHTHSRRSSYLASQPLLGGRAAVRLTSTCSLATHFLTQT